MPGARAAATVARLAWLMVLAGCSGAAPTAPTAGGSTAGGSSSATITIGADGRVTPSEVTVAPGARVLFVNQHSVTHDMTSDPHPDHTDCPEINQVGRLGPGQSRQTGNLTAVRTCGFHDHDRPADAGLRGRIIIR